MNCMFYPQLFIADIDEVSKTISNSFVMCGSKNWDFYFEKKPRNCESEVIKNISLIELDSFDEFEAYNKYNNFFDFSLEHDKPMVLVDG